MATTSTFNARYIGRQPVRGPFSDASLSQVVSELRAKSISQPLHHSKVSDEIRCNLEFSDRSLLITYIKKDEGFESDGESTSTSTTTSSSSHSPVLNGSSAKGLETSASGADIQIIKDHVFGYVGSTVKQQQHSSNNDSLDETSGADSGDDFATTTTRKPSASSTASSSSSSPSASPTAELQKHKFDRKENYPISDVLICHTDKQNSNFVVWVVRSPGSGSAGSLDALVFECFSEESVRELYRKFLEVSKRSKLERHRRRKSDGAEELAKQLPVQLQQHGGGGRKHHSGLWNLIKHTDRNGITHLEVEGHRKQQLQQQQQQQLLLTTSTTTTADLQQQQQQHVSKEKVISSRKPSEKSKFAKELESILSKELEQRRREARGLGPASPAVTSKLWGTPRSSTNEPQSLRQRAPALLLRKLDEFEEMAQRVWAGNSPADSDENRKVWQRGPDGVSKAASQTPPPTSRRQHFHQQSELDARRRERLEQLRLELQQQKSEESMQQQQQHLHQQQQQQLQQQQLQAATKQSATPSKKENNDKQILIPTKTGKEPAKKLYPKDTALPDQLRGARFIPVAIPIQFAATTTAAGQQFTAQPLSLPIYPMSVAWGRYPGDYADANQLAAHRGQWAAAAMPGRVQVMAAEGRGRSRDRMDNGNDARRRAQSKSPARRPLPNGVPPCSPGNGQAAPSSTSGGNGYLDSMASDMSELSKKFREFGDAFRQRMSRKSGSANVSTALSTHSVDGNGQLKSNLKKQRDVIDVNSHATVSPMTSSNSNNDNKKVHFNKFATVQMME